MLYRQSAKFIDLVQNLYIAVAKFIKSMREICYFLLLFSVLHPAIGQTSLSEADRASLSNSEKEILFDRLMDSSNVYYNNGDYRKDLALNFEILKLAFDINKPHQINKGYRNLAYDYLVLGDTLLAKESFEKSMKHANLSEDEAVKALTYMDLANIYSMDVTKSKEEIFSYHNKSIKIFEKLKDSTNLTKAHYNTILTALELEDYKRAYLHLIKAKKYLKFGEPSEEAALMGLQGQYYHNTDNYQMANSYLEQTIALAKKEKFPLVLEDAFYYYSENLSKQGNFEKAYEARLRYEEILEFNQQKIMSADLENISANYQVSEYKKDVEDAETQFALQNEIIQNKSKTNQILLVVAVCIFLLTVALLLALRKRRALVKQLKDKNKEYLKAKKEAEQLSKTKSKFFSTVSHELRTPLYGVIGLSTILLENESLKKHESDLKSLKFSADYLLALINDVLQLNKIDSKNIDNSQSDFNLKELINKITDSFDYMRVKNSNEIHVHISDSVPSFIHGNSVRLSQILMNLIGNACKFTENGNIYVIAETVKNTPTETAIKFYIRDTGMGIPKEKQDSIFEEFSQLKDTNSEYRGTGLGLPIVKKLLKLSNSEIHLQSEYGKGSMFTFTLDFGVAEEQIQAVATSALDPNSLKGKRVLIVEDNRINQTVTKKILEKNKIDCVIAENGLQAVECVRKDIFDLVLMDINMPIMNGMEATKEIRTFNKNIPIVALTAVEVEEMRLEIMNSGMNDIVVKPYDVTKFIQIILKNISEPLPPNTQKSSQLRAV